MSTLGSGNNLTFLAADSLQVLPTGGKASVLGLGHEASLDLGPFLFPTVIAEEVSQGEPGVDVATLPVHASVCQGASGAPALGLVVRVEGWQAEPPPAGRQVALLRAEGVAVE